MYGVKIVLSVIVVIHIWRVYVTLFVALKQNVNLFVLLRHSLITSPRGFNDQSVMSFDYECNDNNIFDVMRHDVDGLA